MQTYQVPKFLVDNIFDMKIQLCTYNAEFEHGLQENEHIN